jgi:hypothetical protein
VRRWWGLDDVTLVRVYIYTPTYIIKLHYYYYYYYYYLDQSKFDPTSFLGPKAQIQTYKTSPNPNFFIHSFQFSVFNFFSPSQGCCRPTHDIITIVEPSIKEGICEKHLIFLFPVCLNYIFVLFISKKSLLLSLLLHLICPSLLLFFFLCWY